MGSNPQESLENPINTMDTLSLDTLAFQNPGLARSHLHHFKDIQKFTAALLLLLRDTYQY